MVDLQFLLSTELPDIVCVTETWLTSNFLNCSLVSNLPYSVYRSDRHNSQGGGVCILTRNETIKCLSVPVSINSDSFELVAIAVFNLDAPFRIITVYRPPVSDSDPIALRDMKVLIDCLQQLSDVDSPVVINGDFNLPNITWDDPVLVSSRDYCSTLFSIFVNQFAFEQYVTESTRPNSRHHASGSLLDIVLCNDPFAICDVVVSEPFNSSDHSSVTFNLNFTNNNFVDGSFDHAHYNFDTVDWNVLNSHLANIVWSSVFSTSVCSENFNYSFYNVIYQCINENVPQSTSNGARRTNKRFYPLSVRKLETKNANLGGFIKLSIVILHSLNIN